MLLATLTAPLLWARQALTARNIVGISLIVTGLLAMPIPIVPGFPLILAGAALLGRDHPVVRPWLAWLRNKTRGQW